MAFNAPLLRLLVMCAKPQTADQLLARFDASPQDGRGPDNGFREALPVALRDLAAKEWLVAERDAGKPASVAEERYCATAHAIARAADDPMLNEIGVRNFIPVPRFRG